MRHILSLIFILLGSLTSFYAAAQEVGQVGNGWREIIVPAAGFAPEKRYGKRAGQMSSSTVVLYQIENTTGLNESPLPASIKEEILRTGIPANSSIFVDRDVAKSIADGTAAELYGHTAIPDDQDTPGEGLTGRPIQRNNGFLGDFFCDGSWRSTKFSKDISKLAEQQKTFTENNLTLTVSGGFNVNAHVEAGVRYKKDWLTCVAYVAELQSVKANGSIGFSNSAVTLTGSVEKTFNKTQRTDLYSYGNWYFIGPLPVYLGYKIPFEYGFRSIFQAQGVVDVRTNITGSATFNYTCKGGNCTGSSNTSNLAFNSGTPALSTGLSASLTVDPFIQIRALGYAYDESISNVSLGLKFSTPAMVFGYSGNTCGDANNDGTAESLETTLFDLQARLSLLAGWRTPFSGQKTAFISVGTNRATGALDKVLESEQNHSPIWSKPLYFKDSSPANKSIFSPMLRWGMTKSGSNYNHALTVSMRPCVPFDSNYFVKTKNSTTTAEELFSISRTKSSQKTFTSTSSSFQAWSTGTSDSEGRVFSNSNSPTGLVIVVTPGTPPKPTLPLVSSPSSLDLVGTSSIKFATLTIKNQGATTVQSLSTQLTYLTSSGGSETLDFADDQCRGKSLAAGSSCTIKLIFDTGCNLTQYPTSSYWNLYISSTSMTDPLVVPIKGTSNYGCK